MWGIGGMGHVFGGPDLVVIGEASNDRYAAKE